MEKCTGGNCPIKEKCTRFDFWVESKSREYFETPPYIIEESCFMDSIGGSTFKRFKCDKFLGNPNEYNKANFLIKA
jgi:hypothetical protein